VNLLYINEAVNESISKNENVFVLGVLVDKRGPIENRFIDYYWINIIEYDLEIQRQGT